MLDAASDLKHANYSREDESARRLWLTQRTRANPWEHRTPDPDAEDGPADKRPDPPAPAAAAEAPGTLIAQTDSLSLGFREAQQIENPFAQLVLFRLGRDPATGP